MEDASFERARDAIKVSIELVKAGKREKALDLLDSCLARSARENRSDLIVMLSRHAEVLANGDPERIKGYSTQRLGHVQDYPFQLYNHARLLLRLGEAEEARKCAMKAYELSLAQSTEADEDLAGAILKQWPDLGARRIVNNP